MDALVEHRNRRREFICQSNHAGALPGSGVWDKPKSEGLNALVLPDIFLAGLQAAPIYVMQIEGRAADGVEAIEAALSPLRKNGIDVRVEPIETLVG